MKFKKLKNGCCSDYSNIPGTDKWIYSVIGDKHKDFYDVKESKELNEPINGNKLVIYSYPEGKSYVPYEIKYGIYYGDIIFIKGSLFILKADFNENKVTIIKYIPDENILEEIYNFNIDDLNLYNLKLGKYPLMLFNSDRNGVEEKFVLYYPEKLEINITERDSFIVRDGDVFYFTRWSEEGIDENGSVTENYRYYENVVKFNKDGEFLSCEEGYLCEMPNGEFWIF